MAKKQNGFGSSGSFAFKGVDNRTDKNKKQGAFGSYPSNRRYGSTVQRTVIEKYDLDSDWTRWRKGYEYYNQAAYLPFTTLDTVMYQGTEDEVPVRFTGERFATKNADSHTHYTVKREVLDNKTLGKVGSVFNDPITYRENQLRHELWAEVLGSRGANKELLRRCIGDRITDGETSANIINVLTQDQKPKVYFGKTKLTDQAKCLVKFPREALKDINPQDLVNEVVALRDVRVERPVSDNDIFNDGEYYFGVTIESETGATNIKILDDNASVLPPSLLEIAQLPALVEADGTYTIQANYVFEKSDYQRFFGREYLSADRVKQQVSTLSFSVLPFKILAVSEGPDSVTLESVPFMSSVEMFATEPVGYVIFNDKSFTKQTVDEYDGVYYHQLGAPDEPLWQRLDTDVDPWMDEVFVSTEFLTFADVYACSCPDYLHAIIRMPEETNNETITNRQRRIPLPSAQGKSSYEQLGLSQAAGAAASWETMDYRTSHRLCKHSVASHFIDKIKVQEPKGYPSLESREAFEAKLEADIKEVAEEFLDQLRRSEITTVEIVTALGTALNFNEVELASIILNSTF